jgi:hypothetical protein
MTYPVKLDFNTLKNSGHVPRFHVNGYIELVIDDHTNLHVWAPDDLPTFQPGGTIHAHRYSFRSHVVYGVLHHSSYEITMKDDGPYDYYEIPDSKGNGADVGEEPVHTGRCSVETITSLIYQQGASYEHIKRRFHSAYTKGLAVSIVERIDEDPQFHTKVVVPVGEEPAECAIDASIPVERLWEIIKATCDALVAEGVITE